MVELTQDVSHHFAEATAGLTLGRVGDRAADAAKKSILDTIGVALAASGAEPAVRALLDLVEDDGGRPEALSWASSDRVPAMSAAFANGALAHCLDFDDQTPWGQHAASSIVPAVFAVAELRGPVTGADLIAAVATGQDVFARLRCNVDWRKDWNLSTVLGIYAGTLSAGRVLGLPAPALQHALGIASQQSAGVMQVVAGTGSDLRALYAGFSARGAVTAALLAARGLTGVDRLFEGEHGVFATFFAGRYDRDAMLSELGEEFRGAGTLYKLWPSVGTSHSHIHATIEAMAELGVTADEVDEIRVYVGDYHLLMCTPLDARKKPATRVDAKFSLPFLVATAAVHGSVHLAHLSDAGLDDQLVRATAARVRPVQDSSLDWTLELPPGRVEIITHDGRTATRTGTGYPGSATRPATWEQLGHKFRGCAEAAAHPPAPDRVEATIELIRGLETAPDVAQIMRLLRPAQPGTMPTATARRFDQEDAR